MDTVRVEMNDRAADHAAVALIAPLGIDMEFQGFGGFVPPAGWDVEVVGERRTGLAAAVMVPPDADAVAIVSHRFSSNGRGLAPAAFVPEGCSLTTAAAELAEVARSLATAEANGPDGIGRIVADTSERFSYAKVAEADRWYHGRDAVPAVACASGNCIDINTYLVAALRAAGYDAAYLTCYFFPDEPGPAPAGMHCWVRTRCGALVQDWDIAHFKKAGRTDVHAVLDPIPGRRFALSYGRSHVYPWRGLEIAISTPSEPMWVLASGKTVWPAPPTVSRQ